MGWLESSVVSKLQVRFSKKQKIKLRFVGVREVQGRSRDCIPTLLLVSSSFNLIHLSSFNDADDDDDDI